MANMTVAEALVLRKHLVAKVAQLEPIKLNGERGIFEVQVSRKSVNESTDEITTQVPKLSLSDVTSEYDRYAKALRVLDVKIQKANWETTLDTDEDTLIGQPAKKSDETTTVIPPSAETVVTP